MAKLPSTQMYPGDWFKDPALRLCSPAARGIWADMLMLMFEAPQRGVFRVRNGAVLCAVSIQNIAKSIAGAKPKHILELIDNGVARVARKDGAIYSKRLIRDELKRRHKAQAGSKGGKQTSSKPQANPQAKRGSSSSTSSSTSKNTTPYSPPSDLPEDPPLGIGGAGPPPDRRPVVLVSETAEHLTALGKAWNDAQRAKKGDDIIFMPEGDRLGRLIAQKIIEAGIPLADILRFDAETMRRSMTHWRAHQAEQAQSNPTAKRYRWGLGYLASGWIDQCEAMRAKEKKTDRAEADKNKLAVDLAAGKAAVDERAAMDAAFVALPEAEQARIWNTYREAHGLLAFKTVARAAWWQEQQKGNSNGKD